ncbi:hypothetical protein EYF80_029885 [Liparis tanakae]|uniref:Uncharacterized protein n=1 Tax=Liparis tanakae TaxID=230148 RepID=A0A4Z2H2B8_9TELE|nr:hypothetical protein EYF80_029885 [Liparis tanakae]
MTRDLRLKLTCSARSLQMTLKGQLAPAAGRAGHNGLVPFKQAYTRLQPLTGKGPEAGKGAGVRTNSAV